MSTKIYNGWCLGIQDVFSVQKKVNEVFRDVLLQRINDEPILRAVVMNDKLSFQDGRFSTHVDYKADKTEYFKYSPKNGRAYEFLDLYAIAKTEIRKENEAYPSDNNVEVVYFLNDETAELFCFVYADNEMTSRFEDEFGEPFYYWNNSDHPEGVTEDEWRGRLEIWKSVLDLDRPIGPQGLTQKVLCSYDLEPSLYYAAKGKPITVPTIETRARYLAEAIVDAEYFASKVPGDDVDMSYVIGAERRNAINLRVKEISDTLKPISYDELVDKLAPRKRKR